MILYFPVLFCLMFELSSNSERYGGESFPAIYLLAEDIVPEYSDVDYYLKNLNKMLDSLALHANDTDINRGLGMFQMKAVLKRTIQENKNKIHEDQLKLINSVILKTENVMSHYFYNVIKPRGWDIIKRVSELYKDEDLQIQAIENYNRNRLQKWILTDLSINDFAESMDKLKMQREIYITLVQEGAGSDDYSMNINISDYCLGQTIYNPKPLDSGPTLKPCVADKFCAAIVYEPMPSVAYGLSHRMLNVVFPRHMRRCYLLSPEEDAELMDMLCAAMYRETVYLARLGYFYRDLFVEHIALCAFLGYEEFHRRHWFRKVASWVDDQGCIAENMNFEANRSRYMIAKENNPIRHQKIREKYKEMLETRCHWHQMALGLVVLAHGVRHAVHFSESDSRNIKDEL